MAQAEYQNILKKLYSLSRFHTEKIGLRNILQLNSCLHDPVSKIPIVHIAGTNGKV
jgi:folylpolyglutamate synthase/dihydropteroate synthase